MSWMITKEDLKAAVMAAFDELDRRETVRKEMDEIQGRLRLNVMSDEDIERYMARVNELRKQIRVYYG